MKTSRGTYTKTKDPQATISADIADCSLDSLIPLTSKEVKAAHYQSTFATSEEAARVAREFRTSQPEIYKYLPCTRPTTRTEAYENWMVLAFARRLCVALNTRYGRVPALGEAQLKQAEIKATKLLKNRKMSLKVKLLPAVRFAERGILGLEYVGGIGVIPDRHRVLLKVLTLLVAFSASAPSTQPESIHPPARITPV